MLTDAEIHGLFTPIFNDIGNLAIMEPNSRPLLAHYTSIDVLEKIIKNEEVWFSNPLFMNDTQELVYGMTEGIKEFYALKENGALFNACGNQQRFELLLYAFDVYVNQFNKSALNVFVFCLSQHDKSHEHGRLSMWRGYGENGNGAAIVFNTDLLVLDYTSPLLFVKVQYASDDDRQDKIKQRLNTAISVLAGNIISDDQLYIVARMIFELILTYSLTEKHKGFEEEQEWRVIYFPNRDYNDMFKDDFDYIVTKNGIEPKLKVKLKPMSFQEDASWKFDDLINSVIIGPSLSSWTALQAIKQMLKLNKKENLTIVSSNIPFRQTR
jgi:hypothetical protein